MFVDETADVEEDAEKVDEAVEEDNVGENEPAAGGSKETDVKTKNKKTKEIKFHLTKQYLSLFHSLIY